MNVVVIGGGVVGLATALQLGRAGHDVTVIERDDTPMPATADEAFEWNRRGAPQVRHSHAFLARLRNLLRDHQPDIFEALLAEGASEMRFGDGLPPEMEFTAEPGDDDLVMIACRRTTFEWVLRRAALGEANVTIRTGVAAIGLLAGPPATPPTLPHPNSGRKRSATERIVPDLGGVPVVTGVRLDDGTELAADLVVAGLLNKWSDYVVDGEPAAIGLVPVGDAVLCTNPLYGRGCSTAYWSAHLLATAIVEHPGDARAVPVAYDEALRSEIHPWYRSSVEQDREARRVAAAALLAGEDPYGDASDPRAFTRSVLRDGLAPALRSDQVVLRAFVRNLNLLSPPDALLTDADFGARVFAVLQTKDQRPPEPSLGPAT